ncbi:MAG: hypothetical protein K9L32_15840 [Chromatiaceae bacterium]|nr:hypothetical protein [Chromatiaceae bacterium]
MPEAQALDPFIEACRLGEFGLDKHATMVEFDSVGRCNGHFKINPVGSGLEATEVSTQTLMQVHQGRVDVIEAGGKPQPWPIELRNALSGANRDDPRTVGLRLEQ